MRSTIGSADGVVSNISGPVAIMVGSLSVGVAAVEI